MDRLTDPKKLFDHIEAIAETHVAISPKSTETFLKEEIVSDLLQSWRKDNWFFLETYQDDSIKFFCVIELEEDCYYLKYLYSDPKFRYKTKDCIKEIKQKLKGRKNLPIFAETYRITPSYKRFANSLNFYPYKITYKCEL